MSGFNVPGLYYVAGKNGMHIARTNLEGCTTECGVTLVKGQGLERCVQGRLCPVCEERILHLGTVGGSRNAADRKLLPPESVALTVGLSQVLRGDEPTPGVASMCILALARLDGRHDYTTDNQPENM